MNKKYKLYPIHRYILLNSWGDEFVILYEGFGLDNRVEVMKIKENQCTRIIKKYGKYYYKIYSKEA